LIRPYVNACYIGHPKEIMMSMSEAATPSGQHWAHRPPLFQSGWEIAAMVAGFVAFWPVGLAILGFLAFRRHKMMREERGDGQMWCNTDRASRKAEKAMRKAEQAMERFSGRFGGMSSFRTSGNAAFDDYRGEVIRRLEDERRKLDEEQRAFADFMLRLKRAKDQQEFDRFMAERNGAPQSPSSAI
jgi:hypothetical protein